MSPRLHIALVGRPNVGKSTIFNTLTGLAQHTGNWPGKTVELAEGQVEAGGYSIRLVDLPGTYTIGARIRSGNLGVDEVVARDYVLEQRPDLLVAVVSAMSLDQDIYLVGQLLTLPAPVLVALNMIDVARRAGIEVDDALLSRRLGVPVAPLAATNPSEVRALLGRILEAAVGGRNGPRDGGATSVGGGRAGAPATIDPATLYAWVDAALAGVRRAAPPAAPRRATPCLDSRCAACPRRPAPGLDSTPAYAATPAPAADRLLTHPELGVISLLAVLGATFAITFGAGVPLQNLLDTRLMTPLTAALRAALAPLPPWAVSLAADGVLRGAGMVVTFLPIIVIFFALLAVLEDVGYLARVAVVMDRFMHYLGLHGKAFLPLFLGFGCNVPAIMGARTVESPRGRVLTTLLIPLVPCSARLAVLNFMAASFFGVWAAPLVWLSISLNVAIAAALGLILSRSILRDPEGGELVMELPAYHRPSVRVIGYLLWFKVKAFLHRAGTLIIIASVVLWAMAYFPTGRLETSYLALCGRALEPAGRLAGLDWRLIVAALASFVAKENALAALAIVFGGGAVGTAGLVAALRAAVTPASALSFLTLVMLFIPCVATVAVTYHELKSRAWTLFGMALLLVCSYLAAVGVYQLALLLS